MGDRRQDGRTIEQRKYTTRVVHQEKRTKDFILLWTNHSPCANDSKGNKRHQDYDVGQS